MMKASPIPHAILLLSVLVCFVSACGHKKKVAIAKPAPIGSSETGIASWYGDPYHGRHAANGEIYDMEKLTAAHRTLPFGTWVRVTNLSNEKSVDVRIQDRGPFVDHRIIDLSRAAAREIELIGPGTAKVRLTIIPAPVVREPVAAAVPTVIAPPPLVAVAVNLFAVQIGAFQDRAKAESLAASMKDLYGEARIVVRDGKTRTYRVLVGEEDSNEKANALAERLRIAGSDGFVVRLDEPADPGK